MKLVDLQRKLLFHLTLISFGLTLVLGHVPRHEPLTKEEETKLTFDTATPNSDQVMLVAQFLTRPINGSRSAVEVLEDAIIEARRLRKELRLLWIQKALLQNAKTVTPISKTLRNMLPSPDQPLNVFILPKSCPFYHDLLPGERLNCLTTYLNNEFFDETPQREMRSDMLIRLINHLLEARRDTLLLESELNELINKIFIPVPLPFIHFLTNHLKIPINDVLEALRMLINIIIFLKKQVEEKKDKIAYMRRVLHRPWESLRPTAGHNGVREDFRCTSVRDALFILLSLIDREYFAPQNLFQELQNLILELENTIRRLDEQLAEHPNLLC